MPVPLRVVLAEDHVVLRALLRSGLGGRADLVVVGEAGTGEEAVHLATTLRPDVLVLDVDLPGALDGVAVAARLAGGAVRVLAHSAHDDPILVYHLLRAGADGYLSKDQPVGRLGEAIGTVAAGEGRWFGWEALSPVVLTAAEGAALAHLDAGGRPGALAAALGVSPEDAQRVLRSLCRRLNATSWYEAVARAWGAGLVRPRRAAPPMTPVYSIRVNVPGHASSARAMSYGA